jgi:hypothetical protein
MSETPHGLHFYWYEPELGDEHRRFWAQLCGGMHRLAFVCDELDAVSEIPDIDLAIQRLSYHMENYLVRIYELRERAARLLATCSGHKGDIALLKRRDRRQACVDGLAVSQPTKDQYLALLAMMDDDIALRNQNTHDTFLSLGYWTGDDIFDPHDAILDLQSRDSRICGTFQDTLREEISRTVQHWREKIEKICEVTRQLLEHLDFVRRAPPLNELPT